MIDTISIFLPSSCISNQSTLQKALSRYENSKIICDKDGVITTEQFKDNGLHLKHFNSGLKITGSIPRYLFSSNSHFATIDDVKLFEESLRNTLGISIESSIIYRLDFGVDIQVAHIPKIYLRCLESSPYYSGIINYPNSKTFCNTNRKKILYDKSLKGVQNTHRIRFEIKYLKRYLDRIFKRDLKLSDLFKPDIQHSMIEQIESEFRSIRVIPSLSYNPADLKTPTDFDNLIIAHFLEERGLRSIINKIEEVYHQGGLNNSKNVNRLKSKYRRLANQFTTSWSDQSLYTELKYAIETEINNLKTKIAA